MACLNYSVVTCSAVFKTIFISLLWLGCMNTSQAQTNDIQSKSQKGQLVEINGQKIYYERFGKGKPLVLLHGGINSIQSSFKNQIEFFATYREVIAIEQVGHGHTPDTSEAFSYFKMAKDTADLMHSLNVSNADFIGWSDGGILALLIARYNPELVHRLVASGANTRLVGMSPDEIKKIQDSSPEKLATGFGKKYRDQYIALSPDGEKHWPTIAKKTWDLWLTPIILENKDLAKINAPSLIINGDKDLVPIEHAFEIFKALPKGQLFVVPGTGHHTFGSAAPIINPVILSFINAP
jgi:pimeloyl-ACP methyl ester carboxylesterase